MAKKPGVGRNSWVDPDDAPELMDAHFKRADIYRGDVLIRRGRPKLAAPKVQINIRLDAEVTERLRADGPGWQTRVNSILRAAL